VEGALRSSNRLRAHHSRNHRVIRRPLPLPLLSTTLTIATKARVRARARGKARTISPVTTAATTAGAPRRGTPPMPAPAPSRCGQGCVLCSNSRRVHHNTPCSLHRHTMGLLVVPPSCPCRILHRTSSKPWLLLGRPRRARAISSHWQTPSTPWP
jgi:hypothetical protein